jgi:hypothetical protein
MNQRNQNRAGGCSPRTCSTFRFRAECEADTQALIAIVPEKSLVRFVSIREASYPDEFCEIEIHGFNLEAMREFCRSVTDGHVMLQTIQPKDAYTGERDYDLI